MRPFKCGCGSTRFVLTETSTVTTCMLVDTTIDNDPEFKTNQVTRQYTLTCTNCGKVYMLNEHDFVDLTGSDNQGLFFDLEGLLRQLIKKRYIGRHNTNIVEQKP